MNNESWTTPNTILSIIMAVLTFVSVIAAILAYRASSEAVQVMREQIKAAARPYVIADFLEKGKDVYLILTNLGASAAHDVKLKFEPYLQYQYEAESGPVKMQNQPILFLAPGRTLEELIFKPEKNLAPSGIIHTVSISYRDSAGVPYEETIKLIIHDNQ